MYMMRCKLRPLGQNEKSFSNKQTVFVLFQREQPMHVPGWSSQNGACLAIDEDFTEASLIGIKSRLKQVPKRSVIQFFPLWPKQSSWLILLFC